ncbi:hypothetical protein GOODEAATRI_001214 [Goodea atripinnis]|uniref:Uncharacterized protein n=1 Tax=Goodea atripinnis TaxID=208336 RepID=A0ABV0PAH2_9TELE
MEPFINVDLQMRSKDLDQSIMNSQRKVTHSFTCMNSPVNHVAMALMPRLSDSRCTTETLEQNGSVQEDGPILPLASPVFSLPGSCIKAQCWGTFLGQVWFTCS